MRFVLGDIIKNEWAGKKNPIRYAIFLYVQNDVVIMLAYIKGKGFEKVRYSKSDIEMEKDIFRYAGHTKVFDEMKNVLLSYNEEGGAE